jgi:hypothetical protein
VILPFTTLKISIPDMVVSLPSASNVNW